MTFDPNEPTSKTKASVILKRYCVVMTSALICLLLAAFGGPQQAVPEPTIISGAGDIAPVVEEYRQVFGGQNNGGEPGSFGTGYREINWDTLSDEESAPNPYLPDFFNQPTAPRARGIVLNTPGEGLFISADSDNPSGALPRFGNINPGYADSFKTFSEERLFSPVGSNIVEATFYVPGTNIPAVVRGFGAVYTDVDTDHTAFEYFDINGNSLGKFATPIADSGLSFLGVAFPEPIVHRVRIAYGTDALGPDDSPETDVAVMDNFIFGEPQAVPIQTQIGADNNFAGNPFIQPQDPALAGGGVDQSLAYGDVLFGTPLSDLLIGGLGVDVLLGEAGEDVLIGGLEHFSPNKSDRKFGGDGNDILIWGVGDGSDLLDGGPGEDVLILGLVGEVENGQTVFRVSEDEQAGQVFIDPTTQLPVVDVTNAPGFCGVVDPGHTADAAQHLQALNLGHLVRFFLREQADSFAAGEQTTDNGLRQTMHLRDIEFLICPTRDGGAIEVLNLTANPPAATELDALALNQRLQLIMR